MRFIALSLVLGVLSVQVHADLGVNSHVKIRNAVPARCNDSRLNLDRLAMEVRDLKARFDRPSNSNAVTESLRTEAQFSRYLLAKTRCILEVLNEELGQDMRMNVLSSEKGRAVADLLRKMQTEAEALQESSVPAAGLARVIENILKTSLRAEQESDYMTLGMYTSDRLTDLDRRIQFFDAGTDLRGGGSSGAPSSVSGDPGTESSARSAR